MQNSFSLNDLYADYAAGLLNKKEFEGAIFKVIQERINGYGLPGWTRDECDDYLSSLYFRISRAISTYQETGSSFETYIGSLVRLTAREYRSRQIRGYLEENAALITLIPDMYACEHEPEYHEYIPDPGDPVKVNNPRQLLILVLKCCSYVSMDFLERIAPSVGINPAALGRMIDHLLGQREKRDEEMAVLRGKINRQFYRCIYFEKKLKYVAEDSIVAQRLNKQLEQGRDKLVKMRRLLARTRLDPSNSQIARMLGITKGTVDSVLYNLRNRRANPDLSCVETAVSKQLKHYQETIQ